MNDMLGNTISRIKRIEKREERISTVEYSRTIGDVIGSHIGLPWLIGFWPFSGLGLDGTVRDVSGAGKNLTNNVGFTPAVYNDFISYADFTGGSWVSRADEADLDITGALTLGGWFWADALTGADGLITKDDLGTNRSYWLYANDAVSQQNIFEVSSTGANNFGVTSANGAFSTGAWHHCVGRFTPGSELAIFTDGVKVTNTVGIPASVFSGTALLNVGAFSNGNNLLDGRACLCFLCADDLSDSLIRSLFNQSRVFFGV